MQFFALKKPTFFHVLAHRSVTIYYALSLLFRIEHLFLTRGIVISKKKRDLDMENIGSTIVEVLKEADTFLKNNQPKGYLIQKVETNSTGNEMRTNIEFHPFR